MLQASLFDLCAEQSAARVSLHVPFTARHGSSPGFFSRPTAAAAAGESCMCLLAMYVLVLVASMPNLHCLPGAAFIIPQVQMIELVLVAA
jgi:hypothetical protein